MAQNENIQAFIIAREFLDRLSIPRNRRLVYTPHGICRIDYTRHFINGFRCRYTIVRYLDSAVEQ